MVNDGKRPLLSLADVLIVVGLLVLLAGLYLFDWRLVVVVAGLLLAGLGAARLRREG